MHLTHPNKRADPGITSCLPLALELDLILAGPEAWKRCFYGLWVANFKPMSFVRPHRCNVSGESKEGTM